MGGVIYSSIEGWKEVAKSDVPEDSDKESGTYDAPQVEVELDAARFSRLTGKQKDAWRNKSQPDLKTWNFEEDAFEEWLERQ